MSIIQDVLLKISRDQTDKARGESAASAAAEVAPITIAVAASAPPPEFVSASKPSNEPGPEPINQQPAQAGTVHLVQRLAVELMREEGLLTPDVKRSQLAEENRLIKLPLLLNVDKKGADVVDNANLIMVTSAVSGEGKTFSAINLAISIAAERDRTVLLVDGDVAKPTAAKRLGIDSTVGLLDLLDGTIDSIADALVTTDLHNLRLLPAGRPHDRATELLASERMAHLMTELATRYDDRVVIFDSPPLLLASESAVLASMMGQIVLVVAAEQTPQHAVADALGRLGADKIIGLVLNKYRPSLGNRHGYGYGYGYGYGNRPATDAVSSA
jgi:protein-tyrosine kinase